jgi:hypothetical protein
LAFCDAFCAFGILQRILRFWHFATHSALLAF